MTLKATNIRKALGNLSVAFYLNCQFVRSILAAIVPGFTAHGIRFVIVISAVLFLLSIRKIAIGLYQILIPFVIVLYYLVTNYLFPGGSATSFFEVFSYAIMPFFLTMLDVDMSKVVKLTLIITAPAMLVSNKIFVHLGSGNVIKMLLSYSILFSASCGLTYLLYYRGYDRKAGKFIYTVLCLPQIYYLYEMVSFGSRGPILSLIVLVILIMYFKPDKKSDIINRHFSFSALLFSIAAVLIIMFSEELLSIVSQYLGDHNIRIRSLNKMIRLSDEADVLHGRSDYYVLALQGFIDSPAFGKGFDMFATNTGLPYPHNFLLQLAYDGGIIMLIIVLVPVFQASVRILAKKRFSLFVPWALLFSASVVGSLFSGDLWMRYVLWFFFAYSLRYGKKDVLRKMMKTISLQRRKKFVRIKG